MTDPTLAAALAAAECAVMQMHYHAPDGTTPECVLHAERLAAQPAVIAWLDARERHLDVKRLTKALEEVEENHFNKDCLSDVCAHPEGECPEYAIGCGDAEEIAREYALASSR